MHVLDIFHKGVTSYLRANISLWPCFVCGDWNVTPPLRLHFEYADPSVRGFFLWTSLTSFKVRNFHTSFFFVVDRNPEYLSLWTSVDLNLENGGPLQFLMIAFDSF